MLNRGPHVTALGRLADALAAPRAAHAPDQPVQRVVKRMFVAIQHGEGEKSHIEHRRRYYDDEDPEQTLFETAEEAERHAAENREEWRRVGKSEQPRSNAEISMGSMESEEQSGYSVKSKKRLNDEQKVLELSLDEREIAQHALTLAPLQVEPKHLEEARRQLGLQLQAINALMAKQWLINVLINRIKTTDQQISGVYGTKTGQVFAGKIDEILTDNHDLAVLLMTAIQERMEALAKGASPSTGEVLTDIFNAAKAAAAADKVYLEFRRRDGLAKMQLLTIAKIRGGMGRQHGTGDEDWFRKQHAVGIELLKKSEPKTYKKNACLHNPDQCVGGPMEILWQLAESTALNHAKEEYQAAQFAHKQPSSLMTSYKKTPPQDATLVDQGAAKLAEADKRLTAAADNYREIVKLHIGKSKVNTLLGRAWMARLGSSGAVNRVHAILQAVLNIPRDQLATTPMNVVMAVNGPAMGQVNPKVLHSLADLPTEQKKRKLSTKQEEGYAKKRLANEETRLKSASEKAKKPRQQSLPDLFYRKGQLNRTVVTLESPTDAPAIDHLDYFRGREIELDEHHQVELNGYQVGSLLDHFGDQLPSNVSLNGLVLKLVTLKGLAQRTSYNPTGLRLGLMYRLRGG